MLETPGSHLLYGASGWALATGRWAAGMGCPCWKRLPEANMGILGDILQDIWPGFLKGSSVTRNESGGDITANVIHDA